MGGALAMLFALLAGDVTLGNEETLVRLFQLIDSIVKDESCSHSVDSRLNSHDPVQFAVEQDTVARMVHLVRHTDLKVVFRMLMVLRDHFCKGGSHRIVVTLPALVVATLRQVPLASSAELPEVSVQDLLQFARETGDRMGSLSPYESLRLWLLCISVTNKARAASGQALGDTCNEFLERALGCVETERCEERRFKALTLLTGTLNTVSCLDASCYDKACDRLLRVSGGLVTKTLQCKATYISVNLYWNAAREDHDRAFDCLTRALKLADDAIHVNPLDVGLFLDVLNQAIHIYEAGDTKISVAFLSRLLMLCSQHLKYIEGRIPLKVWRGFQTTLEYLRRKQDDPHFSEMDVDSLRLDVIAPVE